MPFAAKRARRLAQNGAVGALLALLTACAPGEPLEPSAPLAPPPPTTVPRVDTVTTVWPRLATADIDVALQFSAYDKTPTDSIAAEADWTATGGTVSATGSFQSGTVGEFFVVATSRRTRKRDSARVTVTRSTSTTITRVALLPDSVTLAPGQAQSFSATGLLASGASGAATFVWSSSGGNVSATGAYTAGSSTGRYSVIATLSGGALADTSIITIAAPVPTVTLRAVEVSPGTASLLTGATQQFAALGRMSDGSSQPVAVTWSASAGTVTSAGLFTAPGAAGAVRVVGVEAGGRADTAMVTVTAAAPTLSSLVLTPASASLSAGGTRAFSAAAAWSDGSSATPPLTWSATGGSISSSGAYTAGSTPGTFLVIVQQTGGTVADTAVVTIAAPTLTTLVLNPASVSLASGSTQQFSIGASWSDGSSTVPPVTFAATGGAITGAGLYTAGSTVGTFRVVASHAGGAKADTSIIAITPTITAVEVTPAAAAVALGATQQFTAVARLSSGGTQAVAVTWLSSGGSVSSGGLFTGGATAGTYSVIAVQQGGALADTSTVYLSPTASSGTTADPGALPVVSGQLKNVAAYAALNVAGMAAGTSYADPVTGVRVWKLTSASTPMANPWTAHEYSEGPLQISREWAVGQHTLVVNVAYGGKWLVDVRRGTGLSNWRQLPSSVGQVTFSRDPATPQIAYVTTGAQLRRYNVATNSFADVAPFPASFPTSGWLQQDKNDRWFVALGATAGTVIAWDRTTGTLRSQSFTGLDEPYLEKDGRYVVANTGPSASRLWDLQANTVTQITAPGASNWTHVPALRSFFVTTDVNTGSGITPQYRVDPTGASTAQFTTLGGYYPDSHSSGQWVQSDAELGTGGLVRQWWLRSTYDWSFAAVGTGGVKEGIEFLRLDGTERRLVAHHYSVRPTNGADDYWSLPKATISVDGKLVMFSSNMNNTNRSDVFLVEMPVR